MSIYEQPVCEEGCWVQSYRSEDATSPKLQFDPSCGLRPQKPVVYTPLLPGQTRIICLKAGVEDKISIELYVADLVHEPGALVHSISQAVRYEALSYCWGYDGRRKTINCNGADDFEVLESLHNALRRLRYPHKPRYLWVDALCINQADNTEKSMQIQKIFQIYFKAESVVIWLGEAEICGNRAIEYLRDCSDLNHRSECTPGLIEISKDIVRLCSQPWFCRTWIRQEIFAARHLSLQVGEQTMPWAIFKERLSKMLDWITVAGPNLTFNESLITAFSEVQSNVQRLVSASKDDARALAFEDDKELLSNRSHLTMDVILRGSDHFKATDLRDIVYGTVGMTNVNTQTVSAGNHNDLTKSIFLLVDYNRPVEQAFVDTTLYLIEYHQSLDFILLAYGVARDSSLPSWCPDWSSVPKTTDLDIVWSLIENLSKIVNTRSIVGEVLIHAAKARSISLGNPPRDGGDGEDDVDLHRYSGIKRGLTIETVVRERVQMQFLCSLWSSTKNEAGVRFYRPPSIRVGTSNLQLACQGSFMGKLRPCHPDYTYDQVPDRAVSFLATIKWYRRSLAGLKGYKPFSVVASHSDISSFYSSTETNQETPRSIKQKFKRVVAEVREIISFSVGSRPVTAHWTTLDIRETLCGSSVLAPSTAINDDIVFLLDGCTIPAVLRPLNLDGQACFSLIGPLISAEYLIHEAQRVEIALGNPKAPIYFDQDLPVQQIILV